MNDGERPQLSQPSFEILISLSDRQMHGYAVLRDIERRTEGAVRLTASTLYSALRRMLDAGWIEESAARPAPELDDERRRYFAITAAGRQTLRREIEGLQRRLEQARIKGLVR